MYPSMRKTAYLTLSALALAPTAALAQSADYGVQYAQPLNFFDQLGWLAWPAVTPAVLTAVIGVTRLLLAVIGCILILKAIHGGFLVAIAGEAEDAKNYAWQTVSGNCKGALILFLLVPVIPPAFNTVYHVTLNIL